MILEINRLMLSVHLGCLAEERVRPQEVAVSLTMTFENGVLALQSDRLADSICYQELCNNIKAVVVGKEYHTLEHLAFQIGQALRLKLGDSVGAELTVHKLKPPIESLADGVSLRLRI